MECPSASFRLQSFMILRVPPFGRCCTATWLQQQRTRHFYSTFHSLQCFLLNSCSIHLTHSPGLPCLAFISCFLMFSQLSNVLKQMTCMPCPSFLTVPIMKFILLSCHTLPKPVFSNLQTLRDKGFKLYSKLLFVILKIKYKYPIIFYRTPTWPVHSWFQFGNLVLNHLLPQKYPSCH